MRERSPSAHHGLHAALGLWCALSWASSAFAQEPPAQAERPLAEVVDVHPGATCLEVERLVLRIGRWRERETVDARIRVHVRGDASLANRVAFSVTKEGGQSSERVLADAPTDCDQLHSAVALAIGLSIDATLMDTSASHEPEIPAPPPPAPPAPPPPPPRILPEREPPPAAASDSMRLELAILGGPAVRVFEDTTLMLAPRLTLAPWPWLAFALTTVVTRADGQPVGDAKGHFDGTVAAAGADICLGGAPDPTLSLYACGGLRAGAMFIEGGGFQRNFSRTDLWSAAAASAQVRAWLSGTIAIGAGLSFYVPLAEHVVRVAGRGGTEDQLTELPRLGIGVEFGPVFRFF